MTETKIVDSFDINCAEDLMNSLKRAFEMGGMTAKCGEILANDGTSAKTLQVVETTLTDGSTVIDFRII